MGILWLEVSSGCPYSLGNMGAATLPLIYIFSAAVGAGPEWGIFLAAEAIPPALGHCHDCSAHGLPHSPVFGWGLTFPWLVGSMVIAMRLWIEAIYSLNDLNLSVTANQLFNIREIKRAFPIISSGNLVADILSGFSVYFLLSVVGLENVLLMAFLVMVLGAAILYYLSLNYETRLPRFPPTPGRRWGKATSLNSGCRGPCGSMWYCYFHFLCWPKCCCFPLSFSF